MTYQRPNIFERFSRFLSAPFRIEAAENSRDQLEAFIAAFPGEYCGLSSSSEAVYSDGFCALLGIATVQSLEDIQSALDPSDSAALEGLVARLHGNNMPFTLLARSVDEAQSFKIFGRRAEKLVGLQDFMVLWVEDISQDTRALNEARARQEASDQKFKEMQAALNALPRPVWIRNRDQDIIWVNDTYCDYLSKDRDVILEEQIHITAGAAKRKDSDEGKNARALAKKAMDEGVVQESTAHGIFHGKRLLLRLSAVPIPDMDMSLGFAYDITKEEELEAELKRYELSTNELLGQLRSAIGIFDASEQLIFYNSAYSQLWGLEAGWLDKKPKLGDVMEKLRENRKLPEQADFRSFKNSWRDMFTNLIKPEEDMLHLPDGTALRMLVVPHSMGGLMMTFEDVTSRLALESSYNTLVAVQRETLDNLAEGVSVFGGDGRLKLWNPAYARLWQLQPEDLEGEPHVNAILKKKKGLFEEEEWPAAQRLIMARALNNDLSPERISYTNKAGQTILLEVSAVSLPDGGVLMTYSDITSTVRAENALREKAQALEAAEHLKLDFLANVSYQLRTPLSSIMGFTDILQNEYFGALNDRQKDYTRDIQAASERLLQLINNILDLSSLEAGFMTLEREAFDVHMMMTQMHELVNEWARKEDITVTLDCANDVGDLNADERRLQQALLNLVRNAITFTPEGGTITVSAKPVKAAMHFTVTDTGAGISSEDKARIFEPFERARGMSQDDRSQRLKRTSGGAGLGLSLVQKIAEAHGGRVELESEVGEGTRISVIIPMTSVKTNFKIPLHENAS